MGPSKPRLVDLRGGRNVAPLTPDKIRPHAPRRSNLRLRRLRLRAVVTAGVSVCALLSAYAVHAASYLDRFTIQHISIIGVETISSSQVQAFVESRLEASSEGFVSGRNIFLFDLEQLEDEIAANFPIVKAADVARDNTLGNSLVITLTERKGYALWCEKSDPRTCFLLDDTGVVFNAAAGASTSTQASQYVFHGALSTSTDSAREPYLGGVFAEGHFEGISKLLRALAGVGVTPLGADLATETDFLVPLSDGFYIKASYGEDADSLAKNLALVLSAEALNGKQSELEYVDLRFGNRVYYKFKGQETQ